MRVFASLNIWADDVEAAEKWYAEFLGQDAYFHRNGPDGKLAYAEFRIGDFEAELGIIDRRGGPPGPAAGAGRAGPSGRAVAPRRLRGRAGRRDHALARRRPGGHG